MKRFLTIAALPLLAAVTACGGGNDITVTNDSNVVLNDSLANYASTNDGEVAANDMSLADNGTRMDNGMMSDGAMSNGMAGNEMSSMNDMGMANAR